MGDLCAQWSRAVHTGSPHVVEGPKLEALARPSVRGAQHSCPTQESLVRARAVQGDRHSPNFRTCGVSRQDRMRVTACLPVPHTAIQLEEKPTKKQSQSVLRTATRLCPWS